MAITMTAPETRGIFDRQEVVSERDLSGGAARRATLNAETAKRRTRTHDTGVQLEYS